MDINDSVWERACAWSGHIQQNVFAYSQVLPTDLLYEVGRLVWLFRFLNVVSSALKKAFNLFLL